MGGDLIPYGLQEGEPSSLTGSPAFCRLNEALAPSDSYPARRDADERNVQDHLVRRDWKATYDAVFPEAHRAVGGNIAPCPEGVDNLLVHLGRYEFVGEVQIVVKGRSAEAWSWAVEGNLDNPLSG
jgi:hypothetical protein